MLVHQRVNHPAIGIFPFMKPSSLYALCIPGTANHSFRHVFWRGKRRGEKGFMHALEKRHEKTLCRISRGIPLKSPGCNCSLTNRGSLNWCRTQELRWDPCGFGFTWWGCCMLISSFGWFQSKLWMGATNDQPLIEKARRTSDTNWFLDAQTMHFFHSFDA